MGKLDALYSEPCESSSGSSSGVCRVKRKLCGDPVASAPEAKVSAAGKHPKRKPLAGTYVERWNQYGAKWQKEFHGMAFNQLLGIPGSGHFRGFSCWLGAAFSICFVGKLQVWLFYCDDVWSTSQNYMAELQEGVWCGVQGLRQLVQGS